MHRLCGEPDPLPPPPRQRRRLRRIRTPSIDENAAGSPPDPEVEGLDPRLRGAGRASFVDFCNQDSPRARPRDRPIPGSRRRGCPLSRSPDGVAGYDDAAHPKACRHLPASSSRVFTGQGPDCSFRRPAPSAAIARSGSFAPTRSARTPLVASSPRGRMENPARPGRRSSPARAHRANLAEAGSAPIRGSHALAWSPDRRSACATITGRPSRSRGRGHEPRAASRALPRRRARSAAPEVPSIDGTPRWGRPFSTGCLQSVENERRLFDPPGARRRSMTAKGEKTRLPAA
jgi:hypothetical protein